MQRLNYLLKPEINKPENKFINNNSASKISNSKNISGNNSVINGFNNKSGDPSSYKWDKFKLEIKKLDEPLLSSIFQQVQFAEFKLALNQIWINLDQNLSFFQDIIQDQRLVWLPKLQAVFGEHMSLEINLVHPAALPELITPVVNSSTVSMNKIDLAQLSPESIASGNITSGSVSNQQLIKVAASLATSVNNHRSTNKTLDFANQARWPKVKLVLDFFPGTLSEISE